MDLGLRDENPIWPKAWVHQTGSALRITWQNCMRVVRHSQRMRLPEL